MSVSPYLAHKVQSSVCEDDHDRWYKEGLIYVCFYLSGASHHRTEPVHHRYSKSSAHGPTQSHIPSSDTMTMYDTVVEELDLSYLRFNPIGPSGNEESRTHN